MAHRVLVVDDHRLVRDALKAVLQHNPEFQVTGEASDGQTAIRTCLSTCPDIVLIDVEMAGLTGVEVIRELIRRRPTIKIVVLSMHDDDETVLASVRAGARAFVVKKASSADLLDALRIVARGGSYIGAHVSDRLLARIQCGDLETKKPPLLAGFTAREIQVLRLITDGKSSKEAAVLLGISLETVRSYRKNLMRKLSVTNVAGLINKATSSGLTGWKVSKRSETAVFGSWE